jgi:hypothetical protein
VAVVISNNATWALRQPARRAFHRPPLVRDASDPERLDQAILDALAADADVVLLPAT